MRHVAIRLAAILIALLSAVALAYSPLLLFTSLFAFDAPGSTDSFQAWALFLSLVSQPLLFALSSFAGAWCLAKPTKRLLLLAAVPALAAGILFEFDFDPLRLRHDQPAQECNNSAFTDTSGLHVVRREPLPGPQHMICHALPPTDGDRSLAVGR